MHRPAVTGAICVALALLSARQAAEAHEVSRRATPAGASVVPQTEITVHLDGSAPVIEVSRGQSIRLVLVGAGEGEMHLHGYDVLVHGQPDAPAVFEFEARHAGRFPITAHGADDLLGREEKALIYVEVR